MLKNLCFKVICVHLYHTQPGAFAFACKSLYESFTTLVHFDCEFHKIAVHPLQEVHFDCKLAEIGLTVNRCMDGCLMSN